MQLVSTVFHLVMTQAVPSVYTTNNTIGMSQRGWWRVRVHICAASIQDFPESLWDMGSTVDNALLRCRSSVLLWADIRTSMSSSSSENSCGRQHLGLMKRRTVSGKLANALHTAALRGRKRASSVNLIRQIRRERGNLFTRFSHTVTMSPGSQ